MGEVRCAGERAEAAMRDRGVCAAPVLEGNRVIALAPHDHRRHGLEQVEAVGRADALPADEITLIERWLFFAEAEHVAMLYYGADAA